jgi:transposase
MHFGEYTVSRPPRITAEPRSNRLQRVAMMLRRVRQKYESVLVGPQREDRRVGEEGRPQERDRPPRFGVHRATVKRYCKRLDERGTLEPSKAPGKAPKLDEKAMRLLAQDLEERPWATHSQRIEFLSAAVGVRVSEATLCRAVKRLLHSRKKIPSSRRTR